MTVFLLVPDVHTGGWIWRETADGLRELGAEVHAVTLTGMGAGHDPAADLETHIQDLVRLIDGLDAPQVVVVGHGYGIHPVLGAADRRPDRVARIVHLDAGMPQDGDLPLDLVPDPAVHQRLRNPDGTTRDGGPVPPPRPEEWQRLGSTAGVPAPALERLSRLAAPQPAGTLTRPLRLSGAAAALPATGVLCTASGSSIAMVESRVRLGDPHLEALTDPRVTFFELPTGHWPMLTAPDELAAVLHRAAKGEGHRLTKPTGELPAHLRPFLIDVPEHHRERVEHIDLHLPEAQLPCPAVLFVHGGPLPAEVRPTPRDWPGYVGYAQYAASLGAVGVTLDHRLHALTDYGRAAEDVAAAVELVRADPRVDPDRIALWFFSAGGLLSANWLSAPPSWLRCIAATYPVLAPMPNWPLADARFQPVNALGDAGQLPFVLTRVEREMPEIAATVEEFMTAAEECAASVEVIDVPGGEHGFETVDRSEQARTAVRRAMRTVLGHLRA